MHYEDTIRARNDASAMVTHTTMHASTIDMHVIAAVRRHSTLLWAADKRGQPRTPLNTERATHGQLAYRVTNVHVGHATLRATTA